MGCEKTKNINHASVAEQKIFLKESLDFTLPMQKMS